MIAFAAGFGKIRWQKTIGPSRELAAPRRQPRSTSATGTARLGARRAHGRTSGATRTRGADQGRARVLERPALRRLLRRPRLLPRRAEGPLIWKARRSGASTATRASTRRRPLAYGRVYIGSTDGKVYSFGATTGKLRWSHCTGGYVYASPAVWNRLVFVGSYSSSFYALDAATGDVRWTFKANGQISGSADRHRRRRLLRDARSRPHVRAERAHRQAALDVPRRQVHAGRRREGPPLPRRLRHASMGWSRDEVRRHRRRRASSARTSPRRCSPRATTSSASTASPTTTTRREKEENARGLDVRRLDLADEPLELDGVDGVFHLAGQPGVRSFGDVFPLYVRRNLLATQRVFEACARAGVRVVFASSSSVYGDAERTRRRRTPSRGRSRRTGSRSSPASTSRYAYARAFGLDAVVLRYFTVYGPRQRPDMFFRRVCERARSTAARSRSTAAASSRGASRTSATPSTRRSAAMERGRRRRVYNVGGGRGGDDARGDRAARAASSGRTLDVEHAGAAKGDVRAHEAPTSRASAPRSAGSRGRRSRDGLAGDVVVGLG